VLAADKAQLDQNNAMWGNLTKLGSAGISAAGGPVVGTLLPIAMSAIRGSTSGK
jgi:hypothetical protein